MTASTPIANATPGTWVLDPKRTTVRFRNKTFWGAVTVKGTFSDVEGAGELTTAHDATGRVRLGAASLSTGIGKRDEHLRSEDFFDVEHHPDIVVEVHGATPSGGNQLDLDTTLTIKSTARRLVLPATATLLDDGAVRITTDAQIDREEFGVDGNLVGMIPKTARIEGEAVFTPQAATAS